MVTETPEPAPEPNFRNKGAARKGRWARRVLLVAAAVLTSHAWPAESPFSIVARSRNAQPVTLVAPDFPRDAVAPGEGVRVDVRGTVMPDGSLTDYTAVAPEGQSVFAAAVREVIPWWRFIAGVDVNTCSVQAKPVELAISFEGSSQAPRVFVSYPRERLEDAMAPIGSLVETVDAPTIKYPRKLMGVEGRVQVLYRIEANGQVAAASVLSSTPYGAFDEVVLASARRTRFTWRAQTPPSPVCGLRTFTFCMDGPVELAFAECRR
jgi:TonB family protein